MSSLAFSVLFMNPGSGVICVDLFVLLVIGMVEGPLLCSFT